LREGPGDTVFYKCDFANIRSILSQAALVIKYRHSVEAGTPAPGQLQRNEAVGGESTSPSITAELVRCDGEPEAVKGNRLLQE
jgi:hypothetical protein